MAWACLGGLGLPMHLCCLQRCCDLHSSCKCQGRGKRICEAVGAALYTGECAAAEALAPCCRWRPRPAPPPEQVPWRERVAQTCAARLPTYLPAYLPACLLGRTQARARCVALLSQVLGGDNLAAEYLLLQLVSR